MGKVEVFVPPVLLFVGLVFVGLKVGELTHELRSVSGAADSVTGLLGNLGGSRSR